MRAVRRVVVALAAVGCGVVPAVAASADVDARLAFRIEDERVVESSGLVVSRSHPGLAYTVNDSGDEARVFAVSTRDGSVVGVTTLAGASADDFEALAPAPGGRLLVGDIGDNDAERDSVEVYVIDEPTRGDRAVRPRTVSLTYADGPRDAEAMVVVGRRLFVVSKDVVGGVYAAPVPSSAADEQVLRRVGTAPSIVTDATLLADGDVVLRDYRRGYVVDLPSWQVRRSFPLPRVKQGETLATAPEDRRVYVGSEGHDSPVYVVPVPSGDPAPGAGGGGSEAAPPTEDAGRPGPDGQPGDRADERPGERSGERSGERPGDFRMRPAGVVALLAGALAVGTFTWLRRRRGRHPGRPTIR